MLRKAASAGSVPPPRGLHRRAEALMGAGRLRDRQELASITERRRRATRRVTAQEKLLQDHRYSPWGKYPNDNAMETQSALMSQAVAPPFSESGMDPFRIVVVGYDWL